MESYRNLSWTGDLRASMEYVVPHSFTIIPTENIVGNVC